MVDTADLVRISAQWLSLALIIASFLIVAYLTYRVKTFRSFQFEIFLVLLVITMSEVPKILSDLNLINISNVEMTGLLIHGVAMVFLVAFIAHRASRYLKT